MRLTSNTPLIAVGSDAVAWRPPQSVKPVEIGPANTPTVSDNGDFKLQYQPRKSKEE
jgi:hypothetical protein